ncbi:MAG: hypothetical protein JNM07_11640 [Phycisphaerae bacterium]|nr:hypothetical protein [Phycisphaerae bacterium]
MLRPGGTIRVIAASLGLAGFALAIIAGLWASNSAERILSCALVSLAGCTAMGFGIGFVGERVIEEELKKREREERTKEMKSLPEGEGAAPIGSVRGPSGALAA